MLRLLHKINVGARHVLRKTAQGGIRLKGFRSVDVSKQRSEEQTVMIVGHATTIVQLSCCIPQSSKRYFRISRTFRTRKKPELRHTDC